MRILWVLLLLAGSAKAELALDIHGLSKHFGTDAEYNETNPGIGIAYIGTRYNLIAGVYNNSVNRRTYYAGGEILSSGLVRVGVAVGASYGYPVYTEHRTGTEEVPVYSRDEQGAYRIIDNPVYETREDPAASPMGALVLEVFDPASLRFLVMPETQGSPLTLSVSFRAYF